jgi:EAL domain-containing protein (putative c-di-GMP-specific phosphodiesterase class I)
VGFPSDRLIFEFTEQEKVADVEHLRAIIAEYKRQGFKIAIDDFGAGFSGLGFLSEYTPDIIKLDMDLIRGIDRRRAAQQIVLHIVHLASILGCDVIAEGIETLEEYTALRACGIRLMQGYLFARPGLEMLPASTFPQPAVETASPTDPDLMYTEYSSLAQESHYVHSSDYAETGRQE